MISLGKKKNNRQNQLSIRSIAITLLITTFCIFVMVQVENYVICKKVNELTVVKYSAVTENRVQQLMQWFLKEKMFLENQCEAIESTKNISENALQDYFCSILKNIDDPAISDFFFVTSNKVISCIDYSGSHIIQNNFDYSTTQWYQSAIRSEKTVYSTVNKSQRTNKLVFRIAKKIKFDNEIKGVICLEIDYKELVARFNDYDIGDAYSFLVDDNFGVIYHPYGLFYYTDYPKEISSVNLSSYQEIKKAMINNQNYITLKDFDDIKRTFYLTEIKDSNWYIITAVDTENITKENRILSRHLYRISFVIFIFCICTEIFFRIINAKKMAIEYRKVRNLAYKDQLTMLFNRRAYEEDLNNYQVEGIPENLVVVAFDLNGLKRVNDTMGHASGDEYIKGAGECLEKVFSDFGTIYRTGGDEFVAIIEVVQSQLEILEKKLENVILSWEGETVRQMSISYGYATHKDYLDSSMEKLVTIADDKMYKAKAKYYQTSGVDRRQR